MNYSIDKFNYKTFDIFEKNKLAPRAYFIPFSSKEDCQATDFRTERFNSSRVTLLSGAWQFKYYDKVSEVLERVDTSNIDFCDITVPHTWQRTGFESPVYLNVRYPFEPNPPEFPTNCPVGIYRKTFTLPEDAVSNDEAEVAAAADTDSDVSVDAATADVQNNEAQASGDTSKAQAQAAPADEQNVADEVQAAASSDAEKVVGSTGMEEAVDSVAGGDDGVTAASDEAEMQVDVDLIDEVISEVKELVAETKAVPEDVKPVLSPLTSLKKHRIITFLGVCSGFDLYINGKWVGYSEGSHNSAEFEIDNYIVGGKNEMLVVVYKWSNGTYLEDQDMFRENGIFRDVYITEYNAVYINDYEVTTRKIGNEYDLNLQLFLKGFSPKIDIIAEIQLYYEGQVVAEKTGRITKKNPRINFKDLNVKEWNAEVPELYELYITLKSGDRVLDVIRNYTGFKTIEIKDGVFTFNGKNVKLKGVNHHDSTPHGGYVMTVDELEKDVKIMKDYNCNAVRCAHYPKDPIFMTLCDYYGLYVVDEADIETHGLGDRKHRLVWKRKPKHFAISDSLEWKEHYLDRVKRMYYKNRNHPSIVLWSLGNESYGISNHDACYDFLKATGTDVPVHYEGARHTKRRHYDVMSTMYPFIEPHLNMVKKKLAPSRFKKVPYFFCEYAHAMGFGPGNLKEYVDDFFYSIDNFMGGCIWEFCDHAVLHEGEDAKYKYTYGGDHGEEKHDGNFCVDGLFYPDRTPHTGALNMKAVYRPIKVELLYDEYDQIMPNQYIFTNTNRFLSSDYLDIQWKILRNGIEVGRGKIEEEIAPEKMLSIKIPHKKAENGQDYHINFTYTDKKSGHIVAEEQLELSSSTATKKVVDTVPASSKKVEEKITAPVECTVADTNVIVKWKGGGVVFDKSSGEMTSLKYKEKELLNLVPKTGKSGFVPSIMRAPLDNDVIVRSIWKKFGIDNIDVRFKRMTSKAVMQGKKDAKKIKHVEVKARYALYGKGRKRYSVTVKYVIDSKGKITVTSKLVVTSILFNMLKVLAALPRFGLDIELDRRYENIEYFGLGGAENLPDMTCHTTVGIHRNTVGNLREPYIKPQDSGNRGGVRWLKISDQKDNGILVKTNSAKNISFNAKHFTMQHLRDAKHEEDLVEENTTLLSVDGFVRGSGSNSCGPYTLKRYRINMSRPLVFSFTIEKI